MCDTAVALPNATREGITILAKNSDREPNEAQAIVRFDAAQHSEKTLRVSYIEIPQVKETFEVILSKPFWMWGAEMGVNSKGVAIGNEAVFARVPFAKKNDGLLGMDLLRLALERSDTAQNAMLCITQLLEQYGQDAMAGYYDKNFYYHNSFIIADPTEAYVLETIEKHWAFVKVKDVRSISNGLTIETEFDGSSKGLIEFAKSKGLHKGGEFNFRTTFSDKFFTYFSMCASRRADTEGNLRQSEGKTDARSAMSHLRSHGLHEKQGFRPDKSSMASVCLHAKGPVTPSQTTGSMVAELRKDGRHTVWLTGSSSPCLSLFKPFYFGTDTSPQSLCGIPGSSADDSLFWKHERLHRRALKAYGPSHEMIRQAYDSLEEEFLRSEHDRFGQGSFSSECVQRQLSAMQALDLPRPGSAVFHPLYRMQWNKWNSLCGIV
ncbi:MAG TPA: C69 family dipeptidase [Leptospiraceae bacterium]|nr:C69 family dipeptidase [Leptospirales bacterium]HMX58235.1 C69 family dipeptidase [Leptospiraceae bacterium]HMY43971.1 C69 family dipeptidase [Leptospiraceae bacterium]HMZ38395.1 C69 family dipeptidase [Leptospiraceae bacterium]HNE22774.1 C69 family dipeptidase [Leptospiraceae bacterium]